MKPVGVLKAKCCGRNEKIPLDGIETPGHHVADACAVVSGNEKIPLDGIETPGHHVADACAVVSGNEKIPLDGIET